MGCIVIGKGVRRGQVMAGTHWASGSPRDSRREAPNFYIKIAVAAL